MLVRAIKVCSVMCWTKLITTIVTNDAVTCSISQRWKRCGDRRSLQIDCALVG